jgi:hypothetical protein
MGGWTKPTCKVSIETVSNVTGMENSKKTIMVA